MNALDYLCEVRRTMSPATTDKTILLGLLGETGEVCDLVKKVTAHGHPIDREKFVKELGDVLWYVAAKVMRKQGAGPAAVHAMAPTRVIGEDLEDLAIDLADRSRHFAIEGLIGTGVVLGTLQAIGKRLDPPALLPEIMTANVAKLRARYPEGWDATRSLNRGPE